MLLKLVVVLSLVFKIVLSHSSSNVFNKSEVPKLNINITKAKTDNIRLLERTVESKLRIVRNEELLVPIVQEIVESWQFSENLSSDYEILEKISKSINKKVQPAVNIIKEICTFLTNKEYKRQIFYSLMNPCPLNDKIDFRINHYYNEILHNNFSGEIKMNILNDRNLIFHKFLIENIGREDPSWQSYRQYFLSTSDHGKIENCNQVVDIPAFSRIYTNTIMNKKVLILVDQTSEQIDITRNIVKTMVSTLNDNDKVSILLITADKVAPFLSRRESCTNESMISASSSIKSKIYDFIDSMNRTAGIANHSMGFSYAFDVFDKIYNESNSMDILPIIFLYVSDGVTAQFTDTRNVLSEINVGQARLPHPIIINTCATVNNFRQIPYQTQFLQDITSQNFLKYGINTSTWWHRKNDRNLIGKMFVVNRTMEDLNKIPMSVTTELFKYRNFINNQLTIHTPFYDRDMSNDFVVSITKNCDQRGIFGIDMILNYLIEDIMYKNDFNNSYKFLIDMKGYTVTHSLYYPRPVVLRQAIHPVHITLLEKNKGFNEATWQKMKSESSGNLQLENHTYTWLHISDVLIAGIVRNHNEQRPNVLQKIKTSNYADQSKHLSELIYQRLDTIPSSSVPINTCLLYKQIASFDVIALHLSSKAFESPYAHMQNSERRKRDEDSQTNQNIMTYFRDTRNLFANPGLVDNVRQDVFGIYQIMEFFKKKHAESELRKYVIRRYASSVNGVLQVYPACSLNEDFDASRRPWYVKALNSKGKLAMTEPYLDAGGAGYVISVSYAIYERRYSGDQNKSYQPVAVVSMDFTQGFFYKMLLDSLAICGYDDIKCILMDDKGYLIAHPNILDRRIENLRQPEHITHRESHVANDILMQRKFVEKIACNNYLNGTSQRFYQFNTSINEVISNYANVEKTKYQLMSLKGTNLFVGIINSSSETSGAFCPCSTIDFRCLNCYRMEQNECECPCECKLSDEIDSCATDQNLTSNTICPLQIEYITSFQQPIVKENIETCNVNSCGDMFPEKEDCLGVVGCIW